MPHFEVLAVGYAAVATVLAGIASGAGPVLLAALAVIGVGLVLMLAIAALRFALFLPYGVWAKRWAGMGYAWGKAWDWL